MDEKQAELTAILTESNIHFTQMVAIGGSFMFYTRQDGDYVVGVLDGAGVEAGWNYSYETPLTMITCHVRSWYPDGNY